MCGMTNTEDLAQAILLGVDAVGLVFYPDSPRYVPIEKAKRLLKDLPPFVEAVAVLVNPIREFVQQILEKLPILCLQFHGEETPEFCEQFGVPFIKAIHPHSASQIQDAMAHYSKASALLLDTPSDLGKGGTGLSFDWRIIPQFLPKPYILAGGLHEGNVLDALKLASPYAVDLCSGLEKAPGIKDHRKMSQLIKVLRDRP